MVTQKPLDFLYLAKACTVCYDKKDFFFSLDSVLVFRLQGNTVYCFF